MLMEYFYRVGNFGIVGSTLFVFTLELMVYSFLGWLYESTIFSLGEQGKIINKGYFIGPYCPIYGVVVALNVMLFSDLESNFQIFLYAALVCTVIEYITSYVMEQIFHERYWDYHYYPFNINGRVSLPSSVFFGLTGLVSVRVLHPFISGMIQRLPVMVIEVGATSLVILFLVDFCVSYVCMKNISPTLREYYDAWDGYVDGKLEVINDKKDDLERYAVVRKSQEMLERAKDVNQRCIELEQEVKEKIGNLL